MDIEIVGERRNPLLNRREVRFNLRYSGPTPRRSDIRDKVIAALKSDKDLTVLDSLKTRFGEHTVEGYVKIYSDKESMRVEPEYRLKKNFEVVEKAEEKPEEGEEKKAEVEKEGKVEDKKAEAVKEEKKAEVKKEDKVEQK